MQAVLHPPFRPFSGGRSAGLDAGWPLPRGRSLALGFALVALAVVAYLGIRSSSVFAIRTIEVDGLPASEAAAVRTALAPLLGESLLALRGDEVDGPLAALPGVRSFTYDRAFPNTLRVLARPEVPAAVLRRGAESWLVSRRGRVLRRIERGTRPALPRVWVRLTADVRPGLVLAADGGGAAARALALLDQLGFPTPARTVRTEGELTYVLRSGLEVRLGSARDAELKLMIAALIVPTLSADTDYVDVSLPERPVAGPNPQLGD